MLNMVIISHYQAKYMYDLVLHKLLLLVSVVTLKSDLMYLIPGHGQIYFKAMVEYACSVTNRMFLEDSLIGIYKDFSQLLSTCLMFIV